MNITCLQGEIVHHRAFERTNSRDSNISIQKYRYSSGITGDSKLTYANEIDIELCSYNIPIGSTLYLKEEDYHTMSCSANSIWLVEEYTKYSEEYYEGGFPSYVLGVPFSTYNLYNPIVSSKELDSYLDILEKCIKKLLSNY